MFLHGIYVMSEDPPVFCCPDFFTHILMQHLPGGMKPEILVFPAWTRELVGPLVKTVWEMRRLPWRQMTWMCTTPNEARRLTLAGFRAIWCHQNLFCDETLFKVEPLAKKYDAIYTAVLQSYKRPELAREIPSIRLITGRFKDISDLPTLGLGHAEVNHEYLSKPQINEAINQSRVGLALSAVEGGMLACTEYLLCGIPVVSTPSIGGRDVWLDPGNSTIVPPEPGAVAAAVRSFVAEPPDPGAIRADTLRRSRFFRAALAEIVRRYSGRLPFDAGEIDGAWLAGRFVAVQFLGDYLKSHTGRGFERSDLLGQHA